MAKLKNDKYYTPSDLAEYCVSKVKEIIGENNITEYIEPSAGQGVFLDYLDKPYLSYDIEPEDDRVIKADWLSVDLDYKQGRCIIGNPPFGEKNNLSVAFYKKSIPICDYIAFILPVSQYKNESKLYEFDLIYSEDLKERKFSDRIIHCCFNIYRRNKNGINSKPNYKLKDVEIIERIKNKNPKREKKFDVENENYDLRILAWGNGFNIGRVLEKTEKQYAKEFIIVIHNDNYRNLIIEKLKSVNWRNEYPMTNASNLLQWQVYKYLKEQIPELN